MKNRQILTNKLKQKQKLNLSLQIKESLKILEFSQKELEDLIKEEENENPLLEYSYDSKSNFSNTKYHENNQEDFYGKYSENFRDKIKKEILYLDFSDEEKEIAIYLIDSLNDDYYIETSLSDVGFEFSKDESQILKILKKLQELEPVGIFARNLQERLTIQIEKDKKANKIAKLIIENHFKELSKLDINTILKKTKIKKEEFDKALEYIKTLNIKISDNRDENTEIYIKPDIKLEVENKKIKIILNNNLLENIKIDDYYYNLLKNKEDDKEIKKYFKQNIKKIEQIKNAIEQRNKTLFNVSSYICNIQKDFFIKGENSLKSLKIEDISKELKIHNSTVSRAIKNKYLESERGIFKLSFFLQKEYTKKDGSSISASNIKLLIKDLIEKEKQKNILSDQAISDILQKKQIIVSRRTVCKYREEMGILKASQRKKIKINRI